MIVFLVMILVVILVIFNLIISLDDAVRGKLIFYYKIIRLEGSLKTAKVIDLDALPYHLTIAYYTIIYMLLYKRVKIYKLFYKNDTIFKQFKYKYISKDVLTGINSHFGHLYYAYTKFDNYYIQVDFINSNLKKDTIMFNNREKFKIWYKGRLNDILVYDIKSYKVIIYPDE